VALNVMLTGESNAKLPHFLPHTNRKTWEISVPWSIECSERKPLLLLQIMRHLDITFLSESRP
jgi:hypothetical protein